jgi:hypothetical protein
MATRKPLYLSFFTGEILEFADGDVVAGSNVVAYQTQSPGYTLTADDMLVQVTGTGTINLPSVDTVAGYMFHIKNSGTGTVTVDGYTTDLIDNELTVILSPKDSLSIISDGGKWVIV